MIQKNSATRVVSGLIFVGLLINSCSTPMLLGAEQPKTAPPLQLKLSHEEIKKHAVAIKRVIVGVKALKIAAQASLIGVTAAFIIGGLIASVVGAIPSGGLSIPAIATALGSSGGIAGGILAVLDIIIPFILLELLILPGAEKVVAVGIKGARWLIATGAITLAFKGVEKLERVERDYPGTLTLKQKMLVDEFNELARGSTMKAIIKTLRLKGTLSGIIQSVMLNKSLVAKLGGKKKTKEIVKDYIKLSWRSKNFERALASYRDKKSKYKTIIKDRSSLNPAYHTARLKLLTITINPYSSLIKFKNNKAKKSILKFDKKYPGLKTALKTAIPDFIKKADAIIDKTKTELQLLQKKLRKVMESVVDSIVKQSLNLAKPSQREQAYWITREYVELHWKARNLQRMMDALREQNRSIWTKIVTAVKFTWVKYVAMRLQKTKVEKRIKQIEKKYPQLKAVLKNAWQTFTKKADAMIVEQFQAQS